MNVLLVEDEGHKTTDLTKRISAAGVLERDLIIAQGVREAVLQVISMNFDLIVLDMALPTFSKNGSGGGDGGLAQAVGGIEVLRALKACGRRARIIIVTQYPDVIIGGERIKLPQIGKVVSAKYEQIVVGSILYSYNSPSWEATFDALMERVKCEL